MQRFTVGHGQAPGSTPERGIVPRLSIPDSVDLQHSLDAPLSPRAQLSPEVPSPQTARGPKPPMRSSPRFGSSRERKEDDARSARRPNPLLGSSPLRGVSQSPQKVHHSLREKLSRRGSSSPNLHDEEVSPVPSPVEAHGKVFLSPSAQAERNSLSSLHGTPTRHARQSARTASSFITAEDASMQTPELDADHAAEPSEVEVLCERAHTLMLDLQCTAPQFVLHAAPQLIAASPTPARRASRGTGSSQELADLRFRVSRIELLLEGEPRGVPGSIASADGACTQVSLLKKQISDLEASLAEVRADIRETRCYVAAFCQPRSDSRPGSASAFKPASSVGNQGRLHTPQRRVHLTQAHLVGAFPEKSQVWKPKVSVGTPPQTARCWTSPMHGP